MIPANNKIIISVNNSQKDYKKIGNVEVMAALLFEKNYRERSPVVAEVVSGNDVVEAGDVLLIHHNLCYLPSPYHLYDDLFSVPFSSVLFAKIKKDGSLEPVCGNLICKRVEIETPIPLPPEQIKTYINRAIVVDGGGTKYKKGQLIFHRPHAGYDICYVLNGEQYRVTKVDSTQVCGIMV